MTANTSEQVYSAKKVRAVAGTVVLALLPSPHVLLISSRSDPSRWILPKGGYERKDGPSPLSAALRETWEEAGVRCVHTDAAVLLGELDHTPGGKPNKPQRFWWYGYAVERVDGTGEPALAECAAGPEWPEHAIRARMWFPLAEARKVLTKKNMVPALEWAVAHYNLTTEPPSILPPAPLVDTIIPVFGIGSSAN
ncbi:NUDIX hydrolase domain-like protein [Blastocladiella britannica]|nr:NUDIX hydrolase domain-like protein [Blastocladiella britannica]